MTPLIETELGKNSDSDSNSARKSPLPGYDVDAVFS